MLRGAPFFYGTFPRFAHAILRIYGANYEREMELLGALCDPTRTGIDVGAKVGMYTYRIRDRSSDVIAFEPVPLFNQMLRRVFEGRRGRIEPYALSNAHGHATLRMPFRANGGAEFGRSTIEPANSLAHHTVDHSRELEIETRTLDQYRLHNVGFIKIDVEGHELAVLDGAEETLASSRPNLLVECNDDHQPGGVAKLARWLAAHDYDGYFALGTQLVSIAAYVHADHWQRHGIENFICMPRSRPEVLDAVRRACLAPLRPFTPRVRSAFDALGSWSTATASNPI